MSTHAPATSVWHPQTQALHGGYDAQEHHRSATVPIYQSSSFVFDDADHMASVFTLQQDGYAYSRTRNPTLAVLEQRIAVLKRGVGAIAVACGMAAVEYAVTVLGPVNALQGDRVVAQRGWMQGARAQQGLRLASAGNAADGPFARQPKGKRSQPAPRRCAPCVCAHTRHVARLDGRAVMRFATPCIALTGPNAWMDCASDEIPPRKTA